MTAPRSSWVQPGSSTARHRTPRSSPLAHSFAHVPKAPLSPLPPAGLCFPGVTGSTAGQGGGGTGPAPPLSPAQAAPVTQGRPCGTAAALRRRRRARFLRCVPALPPGRLRVVVQGPERAERSGGSGCHTPSALLCRPRPVPSAATTAAPGAAGIASGTRAAGWHGTEESSRLGRAVFH